MGLVVSTIFLNVAYLNLYAPPVLVFTSTSRSNSIVGSSDWKIARAFARLSIDVDFSMALGFYIGYFIEDDVIIIRQFLESCFSGIRPLVPLILECFFERNVFQVPFISFVRGVCGFFFLGHAAVRHPLFGVHLAEEEI